MGPSFGCSSEELSIGDVIGAFQEYAPDCVRRLNIVICVVNRSSKRNANP